MIELTIVVNIKLTGFNQELILRLIYLWIKSLYDLIDFGMLFIVSGTIVFSFSALEELLHIFW